MCVCGVQTLRGRLRAIKFGGVRRVKSKLIVVKRSGNYFVQDSLPRLSARETMSRILLNVDLMI